MFNEEFVNSMHKLYYKVLDFYNLNEVQVLDVFSECQTAHHAWCDLMNLHKSISVKWYAYITNTCTHLLKVNKNGLLQLIACVGDQPATYGL